jgi:hypothetical protein
MKDAQRPEGKSPSAVGAAEGQEAKFTELERLPGVVPSQSVQDGFPIGDCLNGTLGDGIQKKNSPPPFMGAIHIPQGKIDHRKTKPHDPLEGHLGDQSLSSKTNLKTACIGLAFSRRLQEEGKIPVSRCSG